MTKNVKYMWYVYEHKDVTPYFLHVPLLSVGQYVNTEDGKYRSTSNMVNYSNVTQQV